MSAGPHFTRIDIYTKGKDLFCPKAQNPKSKRCSGSMSGAALWDRLPKPSLGLVPPGKRAWGLGGMGRACQSQWIVTWRISTRPSPTSHVSPRMAEEDIYPLWSPSSQPRALDNSLHLMYHLHKATAPWEQGHLLQLYCLNSQLWGKWWQGKLAAAAAVASAVPASLTGHHSGP